MNKVYVTGTSVISSIGKDIEETWDNLLNGNIGVKPITQYENLFSEKINAYQIDDLPKVQQIGDLKLGKATSLFYKALIQAFNDSSLELTDDSTVGISIGTTMGEFDCLEDRLISGDLDTQLDGGPHIIAEKIYNLLKLNGPKWTITNACAAGNIAISRAMMDISNGKADVMIVGGIDVLSWVALGGFNSLRALSPNVCKPFDKNRKGIVLGEGAGVLILESERHINKRKKYPKAQILGFGLSCDAHHITQPDSTAFGAIQAMKASLKMANLIPNDIDYISAHGTGTTANDLMENQAISSLFEEKQPFVSSIKGHIGHTLGAASAIEAAISVKIMENQKVPHNQNLKDIDEKININLVVNSPVEANIKYVLSNAYAFGGINTSLIIGR